MSISVEEFDALPGDDVPAVGQAPQEDDEVTLPGAVGGGAAGGDRRLPPRGRRPSTAPSDREAVPLHSLDTDVKADVEIVSPLLAVRSEPRNLLGGREASKSVAELEELGDVRHVDMRRRSVALVGAGLGSHIELLEDGDEEEEEEDEASASGDVAFKQQRTRGRLRMDMDKLALRIAAFDHESSESIKYHSVGPHEVQMMKRYVLRGGLLRKRVFLMCDRSIAQWDASAFFFLSWTHFNFRLPTAAPTRF